MPSAQQLLDAIHSLDLGDPVRLLNLSGDQERMIVGSGLQALLPETVQLLPGPGCAASVCPVADIVQAMCMVERHGVTLIVSESLMRQPVDRDDGGPRSLYELGAAGADVRAITTPVEGLVAAAEMPDTEVVMFVAGFETLLAPLAGMILDGIPANLSLLLCGRHVQPLLLHEAPDGVAEFDGLLLPGNRCALMGVADWQPLVEARAAPAAVCGYTGTALLIGIHAVLDRISRSENRIDNCYRPMARDGGNPVAQERMQRVFERIDGTWRGIGDVDVSAYRLRPQFEAIDAGVRFPDCRALGTSLDPGMPAACHCTAVALGRQPPSACPVFNAGCDPQLPLGPCMASIEGTCYIHSIAGAARAGDAA